MASVRRSFVVLLFVVMAAVGWKLSTGRLFAQARPLLPATPARFPLFRQPQPGQPQPQPQPPQGGNPGGVAPAPPTTNKTPPVPNKTSPAPLPMGKTAQPVAIGEQEDPLMAQVEKAIAATSRRYLDADEHTPWQIMHATLALRHDCKLKSHGKKIKAIDFISDAPSFRGEPWFQGTAFGGRGHPFNVPYAFEGHVNQFLAILTMSNLPVTHKFKVDDGSRSVTMGDMINHAKMVVNDNEEVAWTIWFLTHYIEPDATWTNQLGEPWSMERLVDKQIREPAAEAPCGGTHGLFALSYNRNAYLQKYGKLRGTWVASNQKIEQYTEMTRRMQNGDGSFSSEFYRGAGMGKDLNERLKTTGHMLEWLMVGLPQARLNEDWVRRAVNSLSADMLNHARTPVDVGPLFHALDALVIYRDRIQPRSGAIAKQPDPPLRTAQNPETGQKEIKPQPMPLQIKPLPTTTQEESFLIPAPKPMKATKLNEPIAVPSEE